MKNLNQILKILLSLPFLGAGLLKIIKPYDEIIADPELGWVNDFSASTVLVIGVVEVILALGLVIPGLIKKFQFIIPISSIGLSIIMIGAMYTHISRDEAIMQNIVLLGFILVVTVLNLHFLKKQKNS